MSTQEYMDINSLLQNGDPERKALFEVLFGNDTELSEKELKVAENAVLDSVSSARPARTMFLDDAISEINDRVDQQEEKQPVNSLSNIRQLLSKELELDLSEDGLLVQTEKYVTEEDCSALPSLKEFGARKHPPFSTKIEQSSGVAAAHAESSSIYVSAESACSGDRATATAALGFTVTPRYDVSGDIRIRAHLHGSGSQRFTKRGPGDPEDYDTQSWIELNVVGLADETPIVMLPGDSSAKKSYMDYGLRKPVPSAVETVVRPWFKNPSKLYVLITAHVEALAPSADCQDAVDAIEELIHCKELGIECAPLDPRDLFGTAKAEINMAVCGVDILYEPTVRPFWDTSAAAEARRRLLELERRLRDRGLLNI